MVPQALLAQLKECRLLLFDFDGVFTDNKVYINNQGEEMVRCDRSDTFGLQELVAFGVKVMILSTERNSVVKKRAAKLGLDCINGLGDKGARLQELLEQKNINPQHVVYVGNDINDLPCFAIAGVSIAVADAYPLVRNKAHYVTKASGGSGAVREVIELLLQAKQEK